MNVTGVNLNQGITEVNGVKNDNVELGKGKSTSTLKNDTVTISQEAKLHIGTDPLDPKKRADVRIGTDPLDPK